jgi:hypothetical protein
MLLLLIGAHQIVHAALITISWNDNSANEEGFRIERRIGTSGTYQNLASVGANIVTYTDGNVSNATTYCYRVAAFNSSGTSGYSNENCATTPAATTPAATFILTVSRIGTGQGTITSSPAGIACKSDCSETYVEGTVVTLTAVPASGSSFNGWSGSADCTDGEITVTSNISCAATFSHISGNGKPSSKTTGSINAVISERDKIGIYRPSTGEWFLDYNGSGAWDGCQIDLCVQLFTGSDAVPIVGDWNGSGTTKVGLFAADSSEWFVDANGNGVWDGCEIDACSNAFGSSTDLPLVGRWKKVGEDRIAIFRPSQNQWHLDLNGNERLQSCRIDRCSSFSIFQNGDVPIAGDWTGRGISQLGLFRPSTGEWFLDKKDNRVWNGCRKDICISSFGALGDLPVSGDWDGTGKSKIGVFRPSTREWFLDLNGNGTWDGPTIDLYVAVYGEAGDLPVVGKW